MKNRKSKWIALLMVLILTGLFINAIMTARLNSRLDIVALCIQKKHLPCAAIPTRYVMDEPECADKLLRAMNVTNVRILPRNGTLAEMEERIRQRVESISGKANGLNKGQ